VVAVGRWDLEVAEDGVEVGAEGLDGLGDGGEAG